MKLNESLRKPISSLVHLEHSFNQTGDLEAMCERWILELLQLLVKKSIS